MDEYEKIRATMIAEEFGWVGFAADIYGPDYVDSIDGRRANATYYRSNNQLFYGRIQAAVDQMKEHPAVMSDKIAVIGCKFVQFDVCASDEGSYRPASQLELE